MLKNGYLDAYQQTRKKLPKTQISLTVEGFHLECEDLDVEMRDCLD